MKHPSPVLAVEGLFIHQSNYNNEKNNQVDSKPFLFFKIKDDLKFSSVVILKYDASYVESMVNEKVTIGDKAPDFCLLDQNENQVCLKDYLGKNVVLYFYPKDNTPGCSLEAMTFTQYKDEFEKYNTIIFGISKDSCQSHQRFIEKKNLNLTLISDPEKEIHKKYGVWRLKKFMGREFIGTIRSTFLIDEHGTIIQIWDNVKVKGHVEEVLNHVKKL